MQQDTMFSSASGVHHTPSDIAERARVVLGGIELDPASSYEANKTIRAERYMVDPFVPMPADPSCYAADGLSHSWTARSLWLNPPFSVDKRNDRGEIEYNDAGKPKRQRVIDQWVMRWRTAVRTREVAAAMLLVPARTDTAWFQPLFGLSMCFITGRLKFSDAEAGAPFPTMIAYAGPNPTLFYTVFEEIGICGRFLSNF